MQTYIAKSPQKCHKNKAGVLLRWQLFSLTIKKMKASFGGGTRKNKFYD